MKHNNHFVINPLQQESNREVSTANCVRISPVVGVFSNEVI